MCQVNCFGIQQISQLAVNDFHSDFVKSSFIATLQSLNHLSSGIKPFTYTILSSIVDNITCIEW